MTRIVMLAMVLALTGCPKKKEEGKNPPPPDPGSATTGSGPASGSATPEPTGSGSSTGSAAGSGSAATGTGFAMFDDALAGTQPWIAADDKAGLVELHADDDLSGRTKGTFKVERRCGPAAAKAIESTVKAFTERAKKPDYDPARCIDDSEHEDRKLCISSGLGEGDFAHEVIYGKAGESWRVIGVKTYGMGMTIDKYEARFEKLLTEKCK